LNVPTIRRAALQYFATLSKKYKAQKDPQEASKQEKKNLQSKLNNRRKQKFERRKDALPLFEEKHHITGLSLALDSGYMSDEHDENDTGKVDPVLWTEKSKITVKQGIKFFEIRRLMWRPHKVSTACSR